jgi:DNA-binding SARP family transcriptional activator
MSRQRAERVAELLERALGMRAHERRSFLDALGDEGRRRSSRRSSGHGIRSCTDAAALLDALDARDHAAALDLYAGDLLPGFHLPGAPAFQEWLETQRELLRRRAAHAAWDHAVDQERRGRSRQAVDAARRAADLTRDELVVQGVVRLLDRVGDRAAALYLFHDFRRRLDADLGVEPSPETLRLVRAVDQRVAPHRP